MDLQINQWHRRESEIANKGDTVLDMLKMQLIFNLSPNKHYFAIIPTSHTLSLRKYV